MTTHQPTPSMHDMLQAFLDVAGQDESPATLAGREAIVAMLAFIEAQEVELAALRRQVAELHDVERQLVNAEQLVGTERELHLEVERLAARNDELLTLLDRVYRSTSWRVTKPLRSAVELARHTAVDALRQYRGK